METREKRSARRGGRRGTLGSAARKDRKERAARNLPRTSRKIIARVTKNWSETFARTKPRHAFDTFRQRGSRNAFVQLRTEKTKSFHVAISRLQRDKGEFAFRAVRAANRCTCASSPLSWTEKWKVDVNRWRMESCDNSERIRQTKFDGTSWR